MDMARKAYILPLIHFCAEAYIHINTTQVSAPMASFSVTFWILILEYVRNCGSYSTLSCFDQESTKDSESVAPRDGGCCSR